MRNSTNVSPSAAWAWSEEQSGNSEVEAVTARAGRPQALPLSMFLHLTVTDSDITPFRSQSERREFDDELMEREFDDELFGREYDSELFGREPEPLFGFIKKWFNKKKA